MKQYPENFTLSDIVKDLSNDPNFTQLCRKLTDYEENYKICREDLETAYKEHELVEEQLGFYQELLDEIITSTYEEGSKTKLVKTIKQLVEDSQIDL